MSKVVMSSMEKIEKAKLELKKAQEKIKKLEDQRKMEIINLLYKIKPDLSNYDDLTLEKVFTELLEKLK